MDPYASPAVPSAEPRAADGADHWPWVSPTVSTLSLLVLSYVVVSAARWPDPLSAWAYLALGALGGLGLMSTVDEWRQFFRRRSAGRP